MANTFTLLYNLILLLPLVSFLTLAIFGSFLGVLGSMLVCFGNIMLVQLFALYLNYFVSFRYGLWELLWYWVNVDGFELAFSFQFDSLTSIMFVVVSVVSFCVHFYSFVYMYSDPYLVRFLSYLSLFTFFMLVLVSASNFLVLFLGWEGVGVCSYLLIGFWSTRAQAGKAATKAFLVNKVGDLFFLSGIALVFLIFDTDDFSVLKVVVPYAPEIIIEVIVSFLLIGAVGKSAQVGLHTWLPDAMEGPTPVSALIHAATMVTAGVFLLIRCSVFLEAAPRILWLITLWGSLTVLVAGLIGSTQNDIKKIIAYSTCSQLGYMFAVLGMSYSSLGLFHLLNHAFFKALLFLGAGSVIHLMSGEQDTRRMGGITVLSPGIYINMLLATLSLAGFPFLAGFYSKDIIIETSLISLWTKSHFIYWLLVFGALLTASYSIKLLERVFWNDFVGYKNIIYHKISTTPLELCVFTLLAFLGTCSGYYWKDLFLGFGTAYFSSNFNWLGGEFYSKVEIEFLSVWVKLFPCFFVFLAVELESRLLECKWYFNELINGYFVLPNLYASRHIFEQYEKRVLETNGPLFLTELLIKC